MNPSLSNNDYTSSLYANLPNASLMQAMYSTTFGNMNFSVQGPQEGSISSSFPTVPYLSLEALLYQGQQSNPLTSATNIFTGQTAGQQNIGGQVTMNDSVNQHRYLMGYQQGQSGI